MLINNKIHALFKTLKGLRSSYNFVFSQHGKLLATNGYFLVSTDNTDNLDGAFTPVNLAKTKLASEEYARTQNKLISSNGSIIDIVDNSPPDCACYLKSEKYAYSLTLNADYLLRIAKYLTDNDTTPLVKLEFNAEGGQVLSGIKVTSKNNKTSSAILMPCRKL